MQKRRQMVLAVWRAAAERHELWMYVDAHWGENGQENLTEQEWSKHVAALTS